MKTKSCRLSIPGRTFLYAIVLSLGAVLWTPRLSAQYNLITNGAFDMGNTGFQSQYAYDPPEYGLAAGQYAIGPDASRYSSGFSAFYDHTGNHGNMFIVQGATTPDQVAWEETVPGLVPGSTYTFQLFAATDWGSGPSMNPAVLQLAVDGTRIGTPTTLPIGAGQFVAITAAFTATDPSQTVQVFDNNTSPYWNDFALDDLSLVMVVPEPSAWTALSGAVAVVGAVLVKRKWRRRTARGV